jgi:hypothetical protein
MPTSRDQRIADDVGLEQSLRCQARGCPYAWSVNFGAKLCSSHALCKSPREWPFVTQQLLDEQTERALHPSRPSEGPTVTREDAVAALAEVRAGQLFKREGPKAWARRLQAAEGLGRPLSSFQRAAWRQALAHATLDLAARGEAIPRARITDALQATGDLPTEETM